MTYLWSRMSDISIGKGSRRKSSKKKDIDNKVYHLYFEKGLSQSKTARVLKVARGTVQRVFRKNGWEIRSRGFLDEDVRKLYFDEGLSQSKVAERLNVAQSTIQRILVKNGWNARILGDYDITEVYRLYFDMGLTQEQVAEIIGTSLWSIWRIFQKQNWTPRSYGFESDDERKLARKKHRKATTEKIKKMRSDLFGTTCRICGIGSEERLIAIHQKNGEIHCKEALWRMTYLKSVNPEDWAALCIACHRGVHWLMDRTGMQWRDIELYLACTKNRGNVEENWFSPSSIAETIHNIFPKHMNAKELRELLFGISCSACGIRSNEMTMVIHRKDGKSHDSRMLSYVKNLQKLDVDNWTLLCRKCHRHVHWAMEQLDMKWEDFIFKE